MYNSVNYPDFIEKGVPKSVLLSLISFILLPVVCTQETASPPLYYVLPIALPALFDCFSHKRFVVDGSFYIAVAFLFVAVLATLVSPLNLSFSNVVKMAIFVVLYKVYSSYHYSACDIRKIVSAYIIMAVIIAILIFLSYIYGYPHVESDYYLGRYSVGITGVYKNPNYLTAFMNIAFFFLLYYSMNGMSSRLKKTFAFASLVFIFICDYLSGTRAALLTAFLVLAMFFILSNKRDIRFKTYTVIIILIVLVFKYSDQIVALAENFLGNRGLNDDASRQIAWATAMNIVENNILLGSGTGCWSNFADAGGLDYLHNIYLEILLDMGFLGMLCFVLLFCYNIKAVPKSDLLFILFFIVASSFPLVFQNGTYEANLWRCLIVNRLMIDFSINSKGNARYYLTYF